MKLGTNQVAFVSGELDPELHNRSDLQRRYYAAKRLDNAVVTTKGSLRKRLGGALIRSTKDPTKLARLIRFVYSRTQAYGIELGDQYARFYKDGGIILSAKAITGAANNGGGLIRITAVAHGFATGWTVAIAGVGGTVEANGTWIVTKIDADHFDLQGSAFVHAYTAGGTATGTVETATPWTQAQIFDVGYFQSFDVIYFLHPAVPMRKLTRSSHVDWTLATFDFFDGPYLNTNTTATTLTPGAASGLGVTLIASTPLWAATDVGRHVRLRDVNSKVGWAIIVGFTSNTVVTIDIKRDFASAGAYTDWRLGRFSGTTGYPATGTFHGGRMVLDGGPAEPQTVIGSRIGDYPVFAPSSPDNGTSIHETNNISMSVKDDDAFAIALDTNDANNILWLASAGLLFAGTPGGAFKIAADRNDAAITPTNVTQRKISSVGCAPIAPLIVDKNVVYAELNGRALRRITFRIDDAEYVSVNMSVAASHLFETAGIAGLAYQNSPFSVIWAWRTDGRLIGCTFEDNENVIALHAHAIANSAIVESGMVIPGALEDEAWFVARHTVNGATRRDIIRIDPSFNNAKAVEDGRFLDFALTIDNTGELMAGAGCTLTPAAATGSNILFTAGAAVFAAADATKERLLLYRYQDGEDDNRFAAWKTAAAKIKTYVSNTQVRCDILADFPAAAAIAANAWRKTVESIAGAGHLEGLTAAIVGDGKVQPAQVIVGGAATLASPAGTVHVGLAYPFKAWLLRPELQGVSLQGRRKKVVRCHIGLHRCGADGTIGDEENAETIPLADASDTMNQAPPLFTGVKTMDFPGQWGRDGFVRIEQAQPVNACVASVAGEIEAEQ